MFLRGQLGGGPGLPGNVGEERETSKQDLVLALVLVLVLLVVVLVIFVVVLLLPQVSLSGCPGSEDDDGQMLTLVTAKLKFRSSSYRLVGGKVEMGNGTSRVSQAAPNLVMSGGCWQS